jgi:hypothetical protein
MMIDASWWMAHTTALRTLAPSSNLAAWVSCVSLRLEIWISHSCDRSSPEASRELLTRHQGHDYDHDRLGANDDTSINGEPATNDEYLHCVLCLSCSSCEASAVPR